VTADQCHAGDQKALFASIQGVWRKAEGLMTESNAIVPAPEFTEGVIMVLSRSGKRPHPVKYGKGGRVSCDSDCPNWKSLNIYSYCVVSAETNNCLCEFVDYYRKSKSLPSVTRLLLTGVSSGVRRKGNQCV